MRVHWDDLLWALSGGMALHSQPWRWDLRHTDWQTLPICCKASHSLLFLFDVFLPLELLWSSGVRLVRLVVDQDGGGGVTTTHLGDQQSQSLTPRLRDNNKTDHENIAPKMPSRVETSDNYPPCSTCSFLHKSSQSSPGVSCCDESPADCQPSEIFHKCERQGTVPVRSLSEVEVLSWRRTRYYWPVSLHLLVLILSLITSLPLASSSESPDRECCEGPSNKQIPSPGPSPSYPRYNYPPPEVPDFPEYGPHQLPPRVPGYGPGSISRVDIECEV